MAIALNPHSLGTLPSRVQVEERWGPGYKLAGICGPSIAHQPLCWVSAHEIMLHCSLGLHGKIPILC